MRIKLTLTRTNKHNLLPMDYPFYVHSWIYNIVDKANDDFTTFLNDGGYGNKNKPYKLFCFDKLGLGRTTFMRDERLLQVKSSEISMNISFYIDDAATEFIKGIFMNQDCYLGNRDHGLSLKVTKVTVLDQPTFKTKMHYNLTTPWVVSVKTERNPVPRFKYIEDGRSYTDNALKHITAKINKLSETHYSQDQITLTVDKVIKNKDGINVKPDSRKPVKVIGSRFSFWLEAPIEVHQMVWNAGISESSAMSCGWLEII